MLSLCESLLTISTGVVLAHTAGKQSHHRKASAQDNILEPQYHLDTIVSFWKDLAQCQVKVSFVLGTIVTQLAMDMQFQPTFLNK